MSLQEICDALERVGIRPTHQRIEIMKYLAQHRVHPTAEMIYTELKEAIPTFSKTTVYNTLKLLEEKGVVLALATDEDQVRYEANLTPHGHFKCVRCGVLCDLNIPAIGSPGQEIEGNLVLEYQVLAKGICRQCRAAENQRHE
ncbi:MAG TPA: transcriptional repressor [Firmicutes bacterium]|uniref:Transcriptional repressor n=2 Tax=Capillibacterium thermochitinicola TaxID=2699427 RepID=A0A8J6HYJ6_9FIRM|nr:transcriptional repressor [Capillibacterium thermochitinicola]HHW11497.1 transcriptional repressor [Bacillota bacterium]